MRYTVTTPTSPYSHAARLDAFLGNMRLDRAGRGERLARVIQDGILARVQAKRNPDGTPWEDNKPSTIKKKGRNDPGVDTGEMLDPRNLAGTATIGRNSVTVSYAGSPDARQKLEWFAQQTPVKVSRFVWGLDNQIRTALSREFRLISRR
jgi:hypothetical protein